MSVLFVDIGNSQIKWQLATQPQEVERGDWSALQTWLAGAAVSEITQVLVASVKQDSPLRAAMEIIFGQRLQWFDHSQPHPLLSHCYPEPHRLGVDRWLAMLGGIALSAEFEKPVEEYLIVDAGTALTVDHIRRRDQQDRWDHLGGWILPGLDLCQETLFSKTDRVNRYTEAVKVAVSATEAQAGIAFGQNTVSCVQQGAYAQQFAVIDFALRQNPAAELIVTGGNGQLIAEYFQRVYYPNLIFAGLQRLCAPSLLV